MTLYTASIQRQAKSSDGTRASIMRFNRPYYKFDAWIPALAPSEELLLGYKANKISWDEYEIRFKAEVLDKQKDLIAILSEAALDHDITLLCWENGPAQCHRRLVAEECKKYKPKLQVGLK